MNKLAIASVLLSLAAPAYANTTQTSRHGSPVQAGVTGDGSSAAASRSTARSASRSSAGATGGTGGSVSVGNIGGGGGYTAPGRAPDINLASPGGGGWDCPVVGITGGGSGIGGGGAGLFSTISSHCNARKLADQLWGMGYRYAAIAVLRDEFPVVAKAIPDVSDEDPPAPTYLYPNWCIERGGRWLANLPECGRVDPRRTK